MYSIHYTGVLLGLIRQPLTIFIRKCLVFPKGRMGNCLYVVSLSITYFSEWPYSPASRLPALIFWSPGSWDIDLANSSQMGLLSSPRGCASVQVLLVSPMDYCSNLLNWFFYLLLPSGPFSINRITSLSPNKMFSSPPVASRTKSKLSTQSPYCFQGFGLKLR